MADEIIKELWAIKDAMAREAGYDVSRLVAGLRGHVRDGSSPAAECPAADAPCDESPGARSS